MIALCLVELAVLSAAAGAEDFDAKFKKVCDDLLEGAKTNAERTARLHDAARKTEDKKIQAALLEKAVEYGMKSKPAWALNLARKSLDLLEEKVPQRKNDWMRKRIELYRCGFDRLTKKSRNRRILGELLVRLLMERGALCEKEHNWQEAADAYRRAKFPAFTLELPEKEEISQKQARAAHLAGVQRTVARHKDRLQKDPRDAAARLFLLRALVVDLNNPPHAAKYLTEDVDEVWRTYVPLAAKPLSALEGAACKELGDWYRQLADKAASPYGKANALTRARAYYEHFLKEKPQDLVVKLALVRVREELKKLAVEPVPGA